MIKNSKKFRTQVKETLSKKDLTLTSLSQQSGVPTSSLSRILSGKSRSIHDRSYYSICKVLELKPEPAPVSENLVSFLTAVIRKLDTQSRADLTNILQDKGEYSVEQAMALWIAANFSKELLDPLVDIFDRVAGDDAMMRPVMALGIEKLTEGLRSSITSEKTTISNTCESSYQSTNRKK